MIVVRNRFIPIGKRYGAMNLFGIMFVKPDVVLTDEVVNHERIHSRQMRELLYVLFYLLYVMEWIVWLIRLRGDAYRSYMNISFEREAYRHGGDMGYLSRRRRFAQWRGDGANF